MVDIRKHYYSDRGLRGSFNRLARETFGLDFEDWYQNGYWKEKYLPYSVVKDGEVIANVSVNLMDMMENGTVKHLIQLGTVMTRAEYRNQGLIRMLMNEIEADYAGKVDGMYLFANDSVLDFYPKFGYRKASEYQYSRQTVNADGVVMGQVSMRKEEDAIEQQSMKEEEDVIEQESMSEEEDTIKRAAMKKASDIIKQIPMKDKQEWEVLEQAIRRSKCQSRFGMQNNIELFMFYVTKFMQENVYYDKEQDAWAIAEAEGDELLLHAVFAEREANLDDLIRAFGGNMKRVVLGFTPVDIKGYDCQELQEEDTTLFVKGDMFTDFEDKRMMFPLLSHA